MAEDYFVYIPPGNAPSIQIGDESKYILRNFEGLGSALVSPQSQKAPYQVGETFINTDISPRTFSITLRIKGDDHQDLNVLRNELAAACVIEPLITDIPTLGLLKYFRQGLETLEIECCPVQSPQFSEILPSTRAVEADLEFYAPLAYWRATADSQITITNPEQGLFQILEYTEEDFTDGGTNDNIIFLPNVEGP
jgi:hypothetical protein